MASNQNFIADFIAAMHAAGCVPSRESDIVADDVERRIGLINDKPGSKNGSYQLRIDTDGWAVGRFRNWREGITHTWYPKLRRAMSEQDRIAHKQRIETARLENDKQLIIINERAAEKAGELWRQATKAIATAYTIRKQCGLEGLRIKDKLIIVPVYKNNKLITLQYIAEDGTKRFLKDGEKKGGYFPIARPSDDKSTILVCEGLATGSSLRQATGLPVVVAFDAGNLKPVCEALRDKYPKSKLVICADNDAYTLGPKGQPFNPGIEKAQQAAAAIGGAVVVCPEFDDNDTNRFTDWNDYHIKYGLDVLKDRIMAVVTATPVMDVPEPDYPALQGDTQQVGHDSPLDMPTPTELDSVNSDAWHQDMEYGDNGLKGSSLKNIMLLLDNHEDYAGTFYYNEFQHNVMVMRCPKWMDSKKFVPERLSDVFVYNVAAALERMKIQPDTNRVYKAIQSVAMKNRFHPAQDYFNSLKWDGIERLHKWLNYYMGCEGDDEGYLAFVGKKWLTAGVKRVFEPGCKFDHVLVLEGIQGSAKSTALKRLATFGIERLEEYFTDGVSISEIQNKDAIMKVQGCIIIEIPELSGFNKKDDEDIKRWITLQYDDVRLPYAREVSRFQRQFIISGTTNRNDYLKDPTGNRRYWPVLTGTLDIRAIEKDREQLWAEAVKCYREGLYIGPTPEEEKIANIMRNKRLAQDPWNDAVIDKAHFIHGKFKITQIMDEMGLLLRDKDERASRRIGNILQINGYENTPIWNAETKRTERFWIKKEND